MLGRLTSEANPENGTVRYSYDPYSFCWSAGADGDLHTRTDNAGNVTCYRHDLLHRLIDVARWANNAFVIGSCQRLRYDNASSGVVTQPVGYSAADTQGRLIEAETDDCSAWPPTPTTDEWFSYDARGEMADLYQLTPNSGGYYHTSATYWANGLLNTLSGVPGQTAWTFGVDGEGRPSTAVQGTTNLVTGVTYTSAGQPRIISLGAGDSDNYAYDPNTGRMTNYTFTVGSPAVSITGGLFWNPNGTLNKLQISDGFNAGGTQTCKYGDPANSIPGYDDLGRLIKVDCGATVWQQNFSYDPFGNITKTVPINATGYSWIPGYNQANNQYTLSGTSYDANGNLLNDSFHTYTWNAENHLTMIDTTTCAGGNSVCLTYDAFNRMVEKQISTNYKQILYSPIGKTAVMNGQTLVNAYVPLPGGATLYETPGQKNFWHKDWLGSARLSSTVGHSIIFDRAFAPFGETYNVFGQTTGLSSFTGDTQDTFIVNAGAPQEPFDTPNRELHPIQGRWLSTDPAGLAAVDPSNPQTWNRYGYVTNNPLGFIDPLGLVDCIRGYIGCNCDQPESGCVAPIYGTGNPGNGCDPSDASCEGSGGGIGVGGGGSHPPSGGGSPPTGTPPPSTSPSQPIHFPNETNGIPNGLNVNFGGIWGAILPSANCGDLGPCPTIGNSIVGVDDAAEIAGLIYLTGITIYAIEKYGPPLVQLIKDTTQSWTGEWSDIPGCNAQYENDRKICAQKNTRACWNSASERLATCNATGGARLGWPPLR
jgi:RHS repeat-associated protein